MAYDPIFVDGFDNYGEESYQRWTLGSQSQGGGPPGYGLGLAYSRHTWGQGAFIQSQLKAELPNSMTTVLVEGALKLTNRFQYPGHPTIRVGGLGVSDYPHVQVNLSVSQHPYFVYSKDGSVIAGPTTGPDTIIQFNRWYWWMLKVVLHASAGSMELALNHPSNIILTASGIPTLNDDVSAPAYADYVQFSQQFGETFHVDDVVIQDGTTSQGYVGDVVVIGKRVYAVGALADWTPSPAVPNWENVDEVVGDDDTTHNASNVIGQRDSHLVSLITEVPDTSEVLAVQVAYRAKKSDAGSRSMRSSLSEGGSDVFGTERFPSESSYLTFIDDPHVTKPSGGAWGTVGDFNALDLEVGYEVVS